MSFISHIHRCNRRDLSGFRTFLIEGEPLGWVRHDFAEYLRRFSEVVAVSPTAVSLIPSTVEERSAALLNIGRDLVEKGWIQALDAEPYPILKRWNTPSFCTLDRTLVPWFGVRAYGVHLNGFVRQDRTTLWIGKRSPERRVEPNKYDTLVGGGQPAVLSLRENLIKEAWEEASIDPETAKRALPVGVLTYLMEVPEGLRHDHMFLFDLELSSSFIPVNRDGEVAEFLSLPLDRVSAIVERTFDFKFNCALVVIDFLIRQGYLTPDTPDYIEIVSGLHRSCSS